MSKKACPVCPEVEIDMSKVVKQVKFELLSEADEAAPKASVNFMGDLRLTPPSGSFDPTKFLFGYITIPTVINFGAKLADAGVLFPQIDAAYVRGGGLLVTLGIHLATGGRSFMLGSLLGELPMVMDDLANVAVNLIKRRQIAPTGPAATPTAAAANAAVAGLGDVDQQVLKLRDQLNQIQMNGTPRMASARPAMHGTSNRASFH